LKTLSFCEIVMIAMYPVYLLYLFSDYFFAIYELLLQLIIQVFFKVMFIEFVSHFHIPFDKIFTMFT